MTLLRRTPLKRSTKPLRRQSAKQRQREASLRARKLARVEAAIEADGFVGCEIEGCPVRFYTAQDAMQGLAFHHIKRRHHCDDSDENLMPVCHLHHREIHGGP